MAFAQDPKDPVWVVRLQVAASLAGTIIVGADGTKPLGTVREYGPETEITVHAPDEPAARAYVEQQNPFCKIASVSRTP